MEQFRGSMVSEGHADIVDAIDDRLRKLEEANFQKMIGVPLSNLTLVERVREAVRVYEEFLIRKHQGRRARASRTRDMIKRWGEKEALKRTVTNLNMSTGLELLAKYGRLDCAYEQIILDFPKEFDTKLIEKAKSNLARLTIDPG